MKFLAIILSIYLAGLSFTPCSDEVADLNDTSIELIQAVDYDADNHVADFCSPFCSCQCCHVGITQSTITKIPFINIEAPVLMSSYFENVSKEYITSILQPPQA